LLECVGCCGRSIIIIIIVIVMKVIVIACGRRNANMFCADVLLSQPDSFPFKCEMLAMKSDRLMLLVVLMAVCILVTKVTDSVAMMTNAALESCESSAQQSHGNCQFMLRIYCIILK